MLGWLFRKGKIYSEYDRKRLDEYERELELWKLKRKHFPKRFKRFAGKRPRKPRTTPNSWSLDTNLREYVRREIAGRPGGRILLKAYDLSSSKGREKEWRKLKRKLKQKAMRAVFGSKARAVNKAIRIVKGARKFDTVDFLKRKIKLALSVESRRTVDIGNRLRLNGIG